MKREIAFNIVIYALFAGLVLSLFLYGDEKKKSIMISSVSLDNVVVIDPGHGGEDGGAVGIGKVLEKDVNLQVSKRLECLLNLTGIDTMMLRRDDVSLCTDKSMTVRQRKNEDLKERVKKITGVSNAVLISIHQNSFPEDESCHGAQVFYSDRNAESPCLAENIQTILKTKIDTSNKREEKKIPDSVFLMKKINCPAVLVECGFLTNRNEAEKLVDSSYQIKLAAGILSGYINYKK